MKLLILIVLVLVCGCMESSDKVCKECYNKGYTDATDQWRDEWKQIGYDEGYFDCTIENLDKRRDDEAKV